MNLWRKNTLEKHGCSIAYTRPSVVFGYGRQNTAINWAEDFAAKPALGEMQPTCHFQKKILITGFMLMIVQNSLSDLALKR